MLSYAVQLFRYLINRPSLRVRVFRDDDSVELGGLEFEIENVGGRPTSLNPAVAVSFWLLRQGQFTRGEATYAVREVDRKLPPFEARTFTASRVDTPRNYGFSWFRTYRFTTTTGHVVRFHARHQLLHKLSPLAHHWELFSFRALGRLRSDMPESLDHYEAHKRLQGPH